MKKIIFSLLTVTSIVMQFCTGSCQSSKSVSENFFKFNLQKGTTYRYEMQWDVTLQWESEETKTNLLAEYLVNVTQDQDDVKTILVTYKRMRLKIRFTDSEIYTDTDIPYVDTTENHIDITEMTTKMIATFKDKSFTMQVNGEGRITNISGFDEIKKAAEASVVLPAFLGKEAKSMVKSLVSEQDMKGQFQRLLFIFPVKEIKVSDTWNKHAEFNAAGTMHTNIIYTVKRIGNDSITLDMKATMEPENSSTPVKGKQSGTFLVDKKSGLVINAELEDTVEETKGQLKVIRKGKGKITGTVL